MMKKITIVLVFLAALTFFSSADAVPSNILLKNPVLFDGKIIEYQGEAVGDVMNRGDFSWVNVLNAGKAIGVWLRAKDADKILVAGDYSHRGDAVKATGVFHRSCTEHGGDMDIHASEMQIITKGYEVKHPVDEKKFFVIGGLVLICLGLLLIYRSSSKP
jgi:hypothetical protein